MQALYIILAVVSGIAGLVCTVIILIDAFQDEVWKALASLFCCFYFLYYALAEFEHENKLLIVLIALGGDGIAAGFLKLAGVYG